MTGRQMVCRLRLRYGREGGAGEEGVFVLYNCAAAASTLHVYACMYADDIYRYMWMWIYDGSREISGIVVAQGRLSGCIRH